jgi:hypothetical protein
VNKRIRVRPRLGVEQFGSLAMFDRDARRLVAHSFRPLLQHTGPLPDGQPDARPMLNRRLEYRPSPTEIAAGIEHALDPACLGPLLDLVIIAVIRQAIFSEVFPYSRRPVPIV